MFLGLLSSSAQLVTENETSLSLSLELVLSIIAIIISILSVLFEYLWNQKINRTNLEADFFKDIYGDYLMHKIPEARNVIHYNNQIVSDTEDLIEVLNDIRRASLFYKYKDKKFYKDLCGKLGILEDKLVEKADKTLDNDDYSDFIQEINSYIEDIYNIIMNKYIGKNKIRIHKK